MSVPKIYGSNGIKVLKGKANQIIVNNPIIVGNLYVTPLDLDESILKNKH